MTTANLIVNLAKKKTDEMYWVWHDGYQVDRMVLEGIKKTKMKEFSLAGMDELLIDKGDFEDANSNDGSGDWSWVLTILDGTHAVLSGAGCGEAKTIWIDLEEKKEGK